MDERLLMLLALGLVGVGLWATSQQSQESPPPMIGDGVAPDDGSSFTEDVSDAGMSGLGQLPLTLQTNVVPSGRRIRYRVHVRSGSAWVSGSYGGNLNTFRSQLARNFNVRSVWQSNDTVTVWGGKYLWADITTRTAWNNGFNIINICAMCARAAGFTIDQGAGGYGYW